jgi:hypothetical protein
MLDKISDDTVNEITGYTIFLMAPIDESENSLMDFEYGLERKSACLTSGARSLRFSALLYHM